MLDRRILFLIVKTIFIYLGSVRPVLPLLLLASTLFGGCLVRPYQREQLAAPNMSLGELPAAHAVTHVLESREGASGATGEGGGGCGCN